MRKRLTTMLMALIIAMATSAQGAAKKVYDEEINPMEQIERALAEAKSEGKFVICQIGGNWCPWCLRFAAFIETDSVVKKMIDDNFVYIHVNYHPRKSKKGPQAQVAADMMRRLGNPARFGFPVFVVLDENGNVLHIQDSVFLEEGEGYSQDKTLQFFKNWTPKAVKDAAREVDVFATKSGKTVQFHTLMHASIRIVVDGKEIQIDPVSKLGNRTTDYASMPKADYVVVTHEHGDHFDKAAIAALTADGTRLITNKRCADMLGYGEVMANGDQKMVTDLISIEAVPAYNTTPGRENFHPKGRDNGYILTIDGLRVYVAGDTEDIPEMSAIRDIDIAFLPCNQPYTMTPAQLINAARTIKPKVLFPYHYGQTDVKGLPAQLKADGIDVRIRHYE